MYAFGILLLALLIMNINIELLHDRPDLIPKVVKWCYEEFSYQTPEESYEDWLADFKNQASNINKLPICHVLLKGDQLLATASLVEHDLDSYEHYGPWLANVVVAPHLRGQGIGTNFIAQIMRIASGFNRKFWYLHTSDKVSFYTKMGWEVVERANGVNFDTTILRVANG